MKIGCKLKAKRDLKRYSQQEIASLLDISQKTYSNIESDKSQPSLTQLSKLAEVLEFNLLDILQEEGIVFNQTNNEFKDNSNGIVLNQDGMYKNCKEQLQDKDLIIAQQKEIIKLLKDKISFFEKK